MRSPRTPSLLALLLSAALAAPAASAQASQPSPVPARPLPTGEYAVAPALLIDYVECAVEARVTRSQAERATEAAARYHRLVEGQAAEAAELRAAVVDLSLALDACGGRRAVAHADAAGRAEALARARAAASRWRAVAVATGGAAVVLAVLRALSL